MRTYSKEDKHITDKYFDKHFNAQIERNTEMRNS